MLKNKIQKNKKILKQFLTTINVNKDLEKMKNHFTQLNQGTKDKKLG